MKLHDLKKKKERITMTRMTTIQNVPQTMDNSSK